MRNVLAIAGRKGGIGKSTTAANLAAIFAEGGRRVIVIDIDAQASLSTWFRPTTEGGGIYDALTGAATLAACVRATGIPGVSIVTADARLAGLDRALAGEVSPERIFAESLGELPNGAADLVIIDSPPALGLCSLSALVAARHVVIPTTADSLGLAGLRDAFATVESVKKRLNKALAVAGVLVCRADHRRNLTAEAIAAMRETFGGAVLEAVIPESAAAAESPSHGQPLTTYDPGGKATEAYRAAAAELIRRMKGK